VQMVTGGIRTAFQIRNSGKVIMGGLSVQTITRDGYNTFMLYLMARLFNHQLQLVIKLRVKDVYLFCMFLITTITH
jgi:hypothetical protein